MEHHGYPKKRLRQDDKKTKKIKIICFILVLAVLVGVCFYWYQRQRAVCMEECKFYPTIKSYVYETSDVPIRYFSSLDECVDYCQIH